MQEISEAEWLAVKSYPIGCRFSARIVQTRPYGSFVKVEQADLKAIGLINIVQRAT